jgi:hypothetical protein
MNHFVKLGATSRREYLFVKDSSVTTGAGKTGLAFNTASLTAYYVRPGAVAVAITLITQTVTGAWASGGFVEVDATNTPGWYRLDVPDAVFASGVDKALVHLKGASNMMPANLEYQLVAFDPSDAVRFGLTALPNAAAEAAGGFYTRGVGAGQINQTNNGQIDANAARTGGTTNTGRDLGANVLLSVGTGTGQVSLSSGAVPVTGDLTATMKTSVKTQITDALNVDTYAEPGQEAPPATTTLVKRMSWIYKALRNKVTQDSTTLRIYADDGTTIDAKSIVSDDGSLYTRAKIASGP